MFDYVIGFDADTKKCGLVIANVNTKEVLETYNEHILEICEIILPDLVQRFATPTRFINVRIEMPTLQTAVEFLTRDDVLKSQIFLKRNVWNLGWFIQSLKVAAGSDAITETQQVLILNS